MILTFMTAGKTQRLLCIGDRLFDAVEVPLGETIMELENPMRELAGS